MNENEHDEEELVSLCEECDKNITYTHAVEHLELSMVESSNFEYSLNLTVRKVAKTLKINKEDAMNIVLEQIRDSMRQKGYDSFNLIRSEITDDDEE